MASESLVSLDNTTPANINYAWVNRQSGKLSAEHCNDVRQLPFIKGSQPLERADCVANQESREHNPVQKSINWIKDLFN